MRKSVFDEVDGLDEEFQVAFNDVDFCLRIREKGYLIVYTLMLNYIIMNLKAEAMRILRKNKRDSREKLP